MNKGFLTVTTAIVFGSGILAAMFLAWIFGSNTPTVDPEPVVEVVEVTPTPTDAPLVADDRFYSIYMDGCMDEDGDFAYCDCAYNHILSDLGREGMMQFAIEVLDMTEAELYSNEIVWGAMVACLDHL